MTFDEMQKNLTELRSLMAERGFASPEPTISVGADGVYVYLGYNAHERHGVSAVHRGTTPQGAFKGAFKVVTAMPTGEEASAMRYRKSLADTLEVAREEAIADEFVTPIKNTMDTFTEKTLPNYSGEA